MSLNQFLSFLSIALGLWGSLCLVLGFRKSIPLVFTKDAAKLNPIIDKILLQKALYQCGGFLLLESFFFQFVIGLYSIHPFKSIMISKTAGLTGVFFLSLFILMADFAAIHMGAQKIRDEYFSQQIDNRLEK